MNKKAKITIVLALTVSILAGCSDRNETRTVEITDLHCSADSAEKRAEFTLQCIANANPKSDEEPEDWITKCQYMAEKNFCPVKTFIKTQRCGSNLGCIWVETKRELKED